MSGVMEQGCILKVYSKTDPEPIEKKKTDNEYKYTRINQGTNHKSLNMYGNVLN